MTIEGNGEESSSSATIEQDWAQLENKNGDNKRYYWNYDNQFNYNTPISILFRMALDSNGDILITEHSIYFDVTQVDGYRWNPVGGIDMNVNGIKDGAYVPLTIRRTMIPLKMHTAIWCLLMEQVNPADTILPR